MPIVSDSGPILSFARAELLDLLERITGELMIPDAVYDDVVIRGANRVGAKAVAEASWIRLQRLQNRSLIGQLPAKLHIGEREAIALAKELDAALLVDEHEARKEAARLGIKHFGSLRILKEAKDRNLVNQVRPTLDRLVSTGTYVSEALYYEFLRQMGEE